MILTMVTCAAGLLAFAAALDRYLLREARWLEVVMLLVAATCLFWPDIKLGGRLVPAYASDLVGGCLLLMVVILQRVMPARGP